MSRSRDGSATAPRLSVILPAWNAQSTIERALTSVLAEREVDLECVVIDDASTDATADLVRAVADRDPRVVLLQLPTNGGVSNARNRGLEVARGEWLMFQDADDRMLPGGIAALMGPTADPEVRAVIGQRIWTDGERTWLSPVYDIPDIREAGRKSIATHPGLLYYAAVTGKVYHRSLVDELWFEGRLVGDQAWTIRALLRAGPRIEVLSETVFEWWRPHPDRFVETITSVSRASARGSVDIATMARTVFLSVAEEVDRRIDDESTRTAVKLAYFERLIRSDLNGPIRTAIDRGDPATGQLMDAVVPFLAAVPPQIISSSVILVTHLLRPPALRWATLPRAARGGYWRMVHRALLVDPSMARRIAWHRAIEPAFVYARIGPPVGPFLASAVLSLALVAYRVLERLPGSWVPVGPSRSSRR